MKCLHQFIVLTVVFIVAAIYNPVSILAQTTLAIRGGLSRATMSVVESDETEDDDLDRRIGLSLGASATIPLRDNLGLWLDAGYVQKGASAKEDGLEINLFVDYIELSGAGVVSLTPSESQVSVYALVGPSLAFKSKCEFSSAIEGFDEDLGLDITSSFSCGDVVHGTDLGVTAGIGADMAIAEGMTFSVNLRYTQGFTNVDKTDDEVIKNRTLTLLAGFGLPIGE